MEMRGPSPDASQPRSLPFSAPRGPHHTRQIFASRTLLFSVSTSTAA
jgi:hypothetical protein